MERVCRDGRANDLWPQFKKILSPLGGLRPKDRLRRKAKRNSDRAAQHIRVGNQPQNSEIDWPHHPADTRRPRQPGHRITDLMSAFGTKQTSPGALHMSLSGVKRTSFREKRTSRTVR